MAYLSVVWAYVSYVWAYAGANKVEGTMQLIMSWCVQTNEILASKTRALWDRHLDSSRFFSSFVTSKGV